MSLFRKQVYKELEATKEGEVIKLRPLPFRVFTYISALFLPALFIFLFWGEYSSTEVVTGILTPETGIRKVYAEKSGVLSNLVVSEGQKINNGDTLFTVRNAQSIDGYDDYTEGLIIELENAISLHQLQLDNQDSLNNQSQIRIANAVEVAQNRLRIIEGQIKVQAELLRLLSSEAKDLKQSFDSGKAAVSKFQYQEKEREKLATQIRLDDLNQTYIDLQRQLKELRFELDNLPFNLAITKSQLNVQISSLRQTLIEVRARKSYQVKSPISGYVATIYFKEGEKVADGIPVLIIIPENSLFIAELYVPTRASGFLKPNMEVLLRYEAFPYQKFGTQKGRISDISSTIISPRELKAPLPIQEATYRVRVELEKQTVLAFGKEVPLQSGMILDAEIVRDRRKIFEWLFEPLFSIRGYNQ